MNNTQRYVELCREELKRRGERDSDNNLANWLNVSRSAIGHWKTGRNGIGIIEGYRIAKFLKIDSLKVVKELHEDGFKEPELAEFFTEALASRNSNDAA
ncbi:hypothetical protein [Neptuniibacter pectenicola]|uniref:hypothetical protein n=1 Tax=Neptuniibacter pectenicola TaxID=1806669 RepID=UPI00082F4AAE|nr:hypothetical protein [Neptuniibacter pectenicola]